MASAESATTDPIPPQIKWQPGDLVFIAIGNPLYRQVAKTTGSRASHVGIVLDSPGGWVVAESTIPQVKYTSLPTFLARSEEGWLTVRRPKEPLTCAQLQAIRRQCHQRMGRFYHLGFRYHSPRQFCSKLVYDVYRAATGMEIGRLETFGQLLEKQPTASAKASLLWFWRFWFFGWIPWSRLTVTPASQIESPLLETIYASRSAGQADRHRPHG